MLLSRRTGETFAAIQEPSDQFLGQRRSLLAPRLSRRRQNHLLRRHGLGVELEHHLLYFSGVNGREEPHILIPGLAGAGSKVRELGLLDVAPARPRTAKATRATGTWGGMWGGQSRIRLQR